MSVELLEVTIVEYVTDLRTQSLDDMDVRDYIILALAYRLEKCALAYLNGIDEGLADFPEMLRNFEDVVLLTGRNY